MDRDVPCKVAVCKTATKASSDPGWGSWAKCPKTFRVPAASAVALPSTNSPVMKSSASAVLSAVCPAPCLRQMQTDKPLTLADSHRTSVQLLQ